MVPPSGEIPFIITTPVMQSVEEKRKFIRSHVMRGKNCRKMPLRPQSRVGSGKINEKVHTNREYALAIPAKVGDECSLTPLSAELTPDVLATIWRRKQYPCSAEPFREDAVIANSNKLER